MAFFLAPLLGALGAAGTATVAAGAVAAGASIYASNKNDKINANNVAAQNAANTQNIEFQREVNAENRAWELDQLNNNLTRLKDSANLAGFNPLTALGATGGGPSFGGNAVAPSVAPALASFNVASGMGLRDVSDTIENTLGITAANRKLDNDLKSIQIDALRSGVKDTKVASPLPSRPQISGPSGARSVGAGISPLGRQPDAGYEPRTSHIRESIKTDGSVIAPTVGPEIDELISGAILNEYGKGKARAQARTLNESMTGKPSATFGINPSPSTPLPSSIRPRRVSYGDGSKASTKRSWAFGFNPSPISGF